MYTDMLGNKIKPGDYLRVYNDDKPCVYIEEIENFIVPTIGHVFKGFHLFATSLNGETSIELGTYLDKFKNLVIADQKREIIYAI